MDGYTIKALDTSTWDDFAAMVERNSGLFSGCWCTWFHPQVASPTRRNRAYKERMVREGVAHAALVFWTVRRSPGRSTDTRRAAEHPPP